MYIKEKNLKNISKVCNALKPGYYEDVLFLVREINTNLPPRVTIGYDHVKNRTFLKHREYISDISRKISHYFRLKTRSSSRVCKSKS